MAKVAKATFYAEVRSAEAEKRLLFFRRTMDTEFSDMIRQLGERGVGIMRDVAPYRTLKENMRAVDAQGRAVRGNRGRFSSGRNLAITTSAKSDHSEYDYVGVTRFGHLTNPIYPVRAKRLVFKNKVGRKIALLSVDGVVKSVDWAENGEQQIISEVNARARGFTSTLERRSL